MTYLNPGRMGLIGAPTYPMLRDATQTALFEILEENGIPYDLNKADNVLVLRDTRSRILFRAVDDFERLRGTNLAWFGLDELTYSPEPAWLRLEGRLRDPKASRLCGFAVWTPKGYDWVYRKFIAEPPAGYEVTLAKPFENRFLLGQIPDFYERLKESYDESFYRQEVLGQYLNMQGGLVYSAFDRSANIADLEPDPSLPLLWALDFNIDPMCSVVVQVAGEKVLVLDEIVLRRASTLDACEEFYRRFQGHETGVTVYGDASGNTTQTTGTSDYQIVKNFFVTRCHLPFQYRVPKSNPQVRDRVIQVNAKLRSAAGDVQLLVNRKCRELIKDLEQVAYRADSNQIDKEKDRRRTHLSDALGYLIWQECRPVPAIGERNQRLL